MSPGLSALEVRLLFPLRRAVEDGTARLGLLPDPEREDMDMVWAPVLTREDDAGAESASPAPALRSELERVTRAPVSVHEGAANLGPAPPAVESRGRATPPATAHHQVSDAGRGLPVAASPLGPAARLDGTPVDSQPPAHAAPDRGSAQTSPHAAASDPASAPAAQSALTGGPVPPPLPEAPTIRTAGIQAAPSAALDSGPSPVQVAAPATIAHPASGQRAVLRAPLAPPTASLSLNAPQSPPPGETADEASTGHAPSASTAFAPGRGPAPAGPGGPVASANMATQPRGPVLVGEIGARLIPVADGAPVTAASPGAQPEEPFAGLLPVRAAPPEAWAGPVGLPSRPGLAPYETSASAPPGLAGPTLDRIAMAMQPTLARAAELADASFVDADDDEAAMAPSISNTFNVSVALSAQIGSAERYVLQDALTDLLRDAARRQGLDL